MSAAFLKRSTLLLLHILVISTLNDQQMVDGYTSDMNKYEYILFRRNQDIKFTMKLGRILDGDFEASHDIMRLTVTDLRTQSIVTDATESRMFFMFDRPFILIGDRLLQVGEYQKQFFISQHQLSEGIFNIQTTNFKKKLFILITYKDSYRLQSALLSGTWFDIQDIQVLENGIYSTSGKTEFIKLNGELLLLICWKDVDGISDHISLYQWNNQRMALKSSFKVAPFQDFVTVMYRGQLHIFAIENNKKKFKQRLVQYILENEITLKKISELPVFLPKHLLHYGDMLNENIIYVLVVSFDGQVSEIQFNGENLMLTHQSSISENYSAVNILYLEAFPVLVFAHKNSLIFKKMKTNNQQELLIEIKTDIFINSIDYFLTSDGVYEILVSGKIGNQTKVMIFNVVVKRIIVAQPSLTDELHIQVNHLKNILDDKYNEIESIYDQISSLEAMDDPLTLDGLTIGEEIILDSTKADSVTIDCDAALTMNEEDFNLIQNRVDLLLDDIEGQIEDMAFRGEDIVIDHSLDADGIIEANYLKAYEIQTEKSFSNILNETSAESFNRTELPYQEFEEIEVVNLTSSHIFLEAFIDDCTGPVYVDCEKTKASKDTEKDENVLRKSESTSDGMNEILKLSQAETGGETFRSPFQGANIEVEELLVDYINGVDINAFIESLFFKNMHDTVHGIVDVTQVLDARTIIAKTVNGYPVENIVTKTTEQVIVGILEVAHISAENMICDYVNNLNLTNDVVVINKTINISSPVSVENFLVSNDLILNCNDSNCNARTQNLFQIYQGDVIIDGNLTIHDFGCGNDAVIFVDNEEFRTNVEHLYWVKDKRQVIKSNITFSKGFISKFLTAKRLNGIRVEDYLSTGSNFANISIQIENLHLEGDSRVNPSIECAKIARIEEELVGLYRNQQFLGQRNITGKLIVEDLIANRINDIELSGLILKNASRSKTFKGKIFADILKTVGNAVASKDIKVDNLNGISLKQFAENVFRTDKPGVLENKTLKRNVKVSRLNVRQLVNVLQDMYDPYNIINLEVNGDVMFDQDININNLNGANFEILISKLIDKNMGGEIKGKKRFNGGLSVKKYLYSNNLNGINVYNLLHDAQLQNNN